MGIDTGSIRFYGSNKPGNGVEPLRTGPPPEIPKGAFGRQPKINHWTGKHLPLHKDVPTENEQVVRNNVLLGDQSASSDALQTLSNMNLSNIPNGGLLVWNGEEWESLSFTLQDLQDTADIEGAEEGNALVFDGFEGKWVPGSASGGLTAPEDPAANVDTLGSDSEGSETADTNTWEAGGDNGLDEWYVSRLVFDDTSDEILYAFLRKRTYDKYGRLFSVSAETRVTVDTPVAETL